MFLATTALREFWDESQEVVYLGSWCFSGEERMRQPSRQPPVMPSPWDDRERFAQSARDLDVCYERMLGRLAAYLNNVHHVTFSERYWRILIGPWLLHFLHVVHDRHAHLTEAFRRDPSLHTVVLDAGSFRVPRDTRDFLDLANDDLFNLQLFSHLLQLMGHAFPAKAPHRDPADATPEFVPKRRRRVLKRGVQAAGVLLRRILFRRWRVALCETDVPQYRLWAMAWQSRGRILPLDLRADWPWAFPLPQFDESRRGLAALPATDAFERLVMALLPQYFPVMYLEAYHAARETVQRHHPALPSVVGSAVGWYFHEPFKFMAADVAQQYGRLVAIQHGGGYGLSRIFPLEHHEMRISDTFMVWGWAPPGQDRLRNLPPFKLAQHLRAHPNTSRDAQRASTILVVATTNPRYVYRLYAAPQATQMTSYFAWETRFLGALSDASRAAVRFRLHEHDFEHGRKAQFSAAFPGLQWDGYRPLHRRLRESRLVVVDHVGTPCLEALRSNVPTILFWDPHLWDVREDAEPYLAPLRAAGILWHAPEAAAAHAEAVLKDPEAWWHQDTVQRARHQFLDRYAFAREDWMKRWVSAFEREWRWHETTGSDRNESAVTAGSGKTPQLIDTQAEVMAGANEGGGSR